MVGLFESQSAVISVVAVATLVDLGPSDKAIKKYPKK
jgi:hypothetical protein